MQPHPLTFQPIFKRLIWGGRRLGDQLGKAIGPEDDYAESWEIVDHGRDQSIVASGPLAGRTLAQVLADHQQWLLGSPAADGQFPLLLKYLDCNRVLSVQVHPDDAYAQTLPRPDMGKTEAWYIVAAEPGSLLYAGLQSGVDRQALRSAIESGRIDEVLHSFEPSAGDVIFIPAGTVHALGAGLLVAEIQQSSDTTFRLFDWNRLGSDGRPRQLHLQQGLEVTDDQSGPVAARRAAKSIDGLQTMVRCEKFVMRIMETGTDRVGGDGKFHIITVPRGAAMLHTANDAQRLECGQTVLLPAAMESCELTIVGPQSTVMEASLPG